MNPKTLYLICNAHIDPVWLWEWEEGLAETLSTFRAAAEMCEESEGFVFCHNEALLYQWTEEYEPALFEKIRALINAGKWSVMGGWYLQPDCNMPAGESIVRQILTGKRYFKEKFGAEPEIAVNLDPFGHSRGLVQILAKSGYTGYLFCRPDEENIPLPAEDFIWEGFDGSEITACRATEHYNSLRGRAGEKIERWIQRHPRRKTGLLLWGIGDHGGGPSREDIRQIAELQAEVKEWEIVHSCPEEYFRNLRESGSSLPCFSGSLNPWAVGCYTSMAEVKARHRQLENAYFLTEKMLTEAALQGLIEYPRNELKEALECLLFCQFHDILPGSSVLQVESYALRKMDYALEILNRLSSRAFFSLLAGQSSAAEGDLPLFVYNPHPYEVEEIIVCEFQPPEPNFDRSVFLQPEIEDSQGNPLPFQLEKESSNIPLDQRKRLVFRTSLKPSAVNRFNCRLTPVDRALISPPVKAESTLTFASDNRLLGINRKTGLVDYFSVNGIDYLLQDAFRLLVIKDYPDPWGMKVDAFREVEGSFSLMTSEESARFAGIEQSRLEPVRVIEDGAVRTVVEGLFRYNRSDLCLRYKIPKSGGEIELEVRIFWMEKDRMLKLSLPTLFRDGVCRGQAAYGTEEFDRRGKESVAQEWVALLSPDGKHALTVINDRTYGFDFADGELRLSLLRSPAYSGHPVEGQPHIVPPDRFEPRIDQGERLFRFWIEAGSAAEIMMNLDRKARLKNQPPLVLPCNPPGTGTVPLPGINLSNPCIRLAALKMAEDESWLIIRLFEPAGVNQTTITAIPCLNLEFETSLAPFEIKTIAVDLRTKSHIETDLMERRLNPGDD